MRYFLFILFITALPLSSCSPQYKAELAQKRTERAEAKRIKEGEKIMQKAQRDHKKSQTRATRKRMKETRRKSDEWMGEKAPFYIRWYRYIFK